MNSNFTIVLSTYNEESRVEATLKMFQPWAQIVVVDNCSTDNTLTICKKFTDRVYTRKNPGWFTSECNQFRFDLVPTNYILQAFVGRIYPPDLMRLYCDVANEGKYRAVAIYTQMYFYGRPINAHGRPYSNRYGGFQFFDKRYIDLSKAKIHHELPLVGSFENILFPPHEARFCVCTLRDDDSYSTEVKYAKYSSEDARARFERGERTDLIRAMWRIAFTLLRALLWRGSVFQGAPGIIASVWSTCYAAQMNIKLWEYQNKMTRENIRALNSEQMRKITES